ncbi:MAG TPA: GAF domain-containing protein [Oscillatoriaceae cyanobacterium]
MDPTGRELPTAALGELNDLLWALPASLEPERIVAVLLEKTSRLFETPLACVWLDDGADFRLAGCYGFTDKKAEQLWGALRLIDRREELVSLAGADLAATSFGKRRLGALTAVRLRTPDAPLGWLVLARFDARPFSLLEQQLLQIIAGRVSVALQNARLYQETQARSQELELLYEISQLLGSTLNLDELLARLVRRMTETFHITACGIRLVDPETNTVPMRAMYHRDPEEEARLWTHFRERPAILGQGSTALLIHQRKGYSVSSLEESLIEPADREVLGNGSMAAVPLLVRDRVVGALYWFRAGRQNPLTETMLPLMTHLASQVALALDHAQLYTEMERQVAERTVRLEDTKTELVRRLDAGRDLSEQIRGQLHSILGYAGLLQHALDRPDSDRARQHGYLDKLMNAAEAVNGLINELLKQVRQGRSD